MARPKQKRVVQHPPKVKGFNPMGFYAGNRSSIKLNIEEFEVVRLLDYENLSQEEAAVHLRVSRPTLTRIYNSARKKIAVALIEANQLLIEGGNYIFKETWFLCKTCLSKFNKPGDEDLQYCPICHSDDLKQLNPEQ